MARFGLIDPSTYAGMQVVEIPDAEAMLTARMDSFKAKWIEHDPPLGAAYDVGGLEFDPAKVIQENDTVYELNVRTRINHAARAVTLAYSVGTDLDAVASRYPSGVPRVSSEIYSDDAPYAERTEKDNRYRTRIWLSPNALAAAGTPEAYEFFALTALPEAVDASCTAKRTPEEVVSIVTVMVAGPDPRPTRAQLIQVRKAIEQPAVMPATDILSVQGPAVITVAYKVRLYFYPWADAEQTEALVIAEMNAFLKKRYWLGFDHARSEIMAACDQAGVHSVILEGMAGDTIEAGPTQLIKASFETFRMTERKQ